MNIQFGCGGNFLRDFHNHDFDADIRKPLPYENGVADFVFIEHCLEHVTGPEAFRFLQEAFRILKPGGVLRVCVPELKRLALAKRHDIIVNHGHEMVYCDENLRLMLETVGFPVMNIHQTGRKDIDSHWKVIGRELDDLETLRMEATK